MPRCKAKRCMVGQALTERERTGIVMRRPNRGATVRHLSAQEDEELAQVRDTLHQPAIKRLKRPGNPVLVDKPIECPHCHDRAVLEHHPRHIDTDHEAFHACLFGAGGNQHQADAIANSARTWQALRLDPTLELAQPKTPRHEHKSMIAAAREGDQRALQQLVATHIQASKPLSLKPRSTRWIDFQWTWCVR